MVGGGASPLRTTHQLRSFQTKSLMNLGHPGLRSAGAKTAMILSTSLPTSAFRADTKHRHRHRHRQNISQVDQNQQQPWRATRSVRTTAVQESVSGTCVQWKPPRWSIRNGEGAYNTPLYYAFILRVYITRIHASVEVYARCVFVCLRPHLRLIKRLTHPRHHRER